MSGFPQVVQLETENEVLQWRLFELEERIRRDSEELRLWSAAGGGAAPAQQPAAAEGDPVGSERRDAPASDSHASADKAADVTERAEPPAVERRAEGGWRFRNRLDTQRPGLMATAVAVAVAMPPAKVTAVATRMAAARTLAMTATVTRTGR